MRRIDDGVNALPVHLEVWHLESRPEPSKHTDVIICRVAHKSPDS